MYAVRVLTDGRIFIIRASDKVWGSYTAAGNPSHGCTNRLNLEPHNVRTLAEDAQAEWFNKHLHGVS